MCGSWDAGWPQYDQKETIETECLNENFPTQTEASNSNPWQRADSLTPKRALDEISDVLPGR